MKKEAIIILTLTLIMFGCFNSKEVKDTKVQKENNPIANSTDISKHSLLEGYNEHPIELSKSWKLCAHSYEDLTTNYNVCTKIVLFPDGNGHAIKPDNSKSNFVWGCKEDSVNFSFITPKDQEAFFSTSNLFFFDKSKLNRLNLKVKKSTYYLR